MEGSFLLSALPVGKSANIVKIKALGDLKRRFADLGIIEGSSVSAVQRGFFKDPTAYDIRGAIIALRREDSNKILVKM